MTTRESCHACGVLRRCGKRAGMGLWAVLLVLACASRRPEPPASARPEPPASTRIVRRPTIAELREGMRRVDVEDRVGLLLLRDQIGDMRVYVEPQTRCYYIFDRRDYLVDWSCR